MDCSICLDTIENRCTRVYCCKKTFCESCITEWLAKNKTCPNCRNKCSIATLNTENAYIENCRDLVEKHNNKVITKNDVHNVLQKLRNDMKKYYKSSVQYNKKVTEAAEIYGDEMLQYLIK